jgi:DNA-binding transcriptional regulator YiaG
LNANLRWLATGRAPKCPFTPLLDEILNKIPNKALFSEAYDSVVASLVDARLQELAEMYRIQPEELGKSSFILDQRRLGGTLADSHLANVLDFIRTNGEAKTEEQKLSFANALSDVCFRMMGDSGKPLTEVNKTETMQPMTMKALLARVRKATAERGEKSKLARSLGVSVANVSQWLSGDREPSGETTLKLLHWVEEHERK